MSIENLKTNVLLRSLSTFAYFFIEIYKELRSPRKTSLRPPKYLLHLPSKIISMYQIKNIDCFAKPVDLSKPIQDHQIVQLPRLRKTTFWGCPYLGLGKSLLRQTQGASSRVCALWAWAKAAAAPSMLRPTPCPLLLGATAA